MPVGQQGWAISDNEPHGRVTPSSRQARCGDVPERAEAGRDLCSAGRGKGGTVMPLWEHGQAEQLRSRFLGQADVEFKCKLRMEGIRPRKAAL